MPATRTVLALILVCTTSLWAQTNEPAVNRNATVAFVYVGQNTTPTRISVFSVLGNGLVEPIPGNQTAVPVQDIVVSSGFLWATNGTIIATLTRKADGNLFETATISGIAHNDTPQESEVGGLTLDRSGSSLYAGEINFQGTDNAAYAVFGVKSVNHEGIVDFVANGPISSDFNSLLSFSANNQFAYGHGCFFADWDIFAFHRLSTGALQLFDPGNTFPPNPNNDLLCPSAMGASAKNILAIGYGPAEDGSKQSLLTYRITSTGGLEEIADSILQTNFTGMGLRFDPSGDFMAAWGNKGVAAFRLNANGTLSQLGPVVEPGIIFIDAHWDGFGHLYAISNSALYVFTLHNGGLTLTGTPTALPQAVSLAVLPTT